MIVELEKLIEHRFYKLDTFYKVNCDNVVDNIYTKVDINVPQTKVCGGLLWLHMIEGSVNLICKWCKAEYDIVRVCNICGEEYLFEDITCDGCEPFVIDIATWKISIQEADKAIKKINQAFKKSLIAEKEWKSALQINRDEIIKCQKNLEKEEISFLSTS